MVHGHHRGRHRAGPPRRLAAAEVRLTGRDVPNFRRIARTLPWAARNLLRWEIPVLVLADVAGLHGLTRGATWLISMGGESLLETVSLPFGPGVPLFPVLYAAWGAAWTALSTAVLLGLARGGKGLSLPLVRRLAGPAAVAALAVFSWSLCEYALPWRLQVQLHAVPLLRQVPAGAVAFWAAWYLFERSEEEEGRQGLRMRVLLGPGLILLFAGRVLPLAAVALGMDGVTLRYAGTDHDFMATYVVTWWLSVVSICQATALFGALWFLRFLVATGGEDAAGPRALGNSPG